MKINDFTPLIVGSVGGIMTLTNINALLTTLTLIVGLIYSVNKLVREIKRQSKK
jgi:hypothetical protein